jgi:hypothetical protein
VAKKLLDRVEDGEKEHHPAARREMKVASILTNDMPDSDINMSEADTVK